MSILSVPRRVIKLKAAPRRWCATPRCEGWAEPNHRLCPACEAATAAREALDRLIRSGDAGCIRAAAEVIHSIDLDGVLWTEPALRAVIENGIDSAATMWWRSGYSLDAVRQVRDPVIDRDDDADFWGPSAAEVDAAERAGYLAAEM